jgi:hypothetical protein
MQNDSIFLWDSLLLYIFIVYNNEVQEFHQRFFYMFFIVKTTRNCLFKSNTLLSFQATFRPPANLFDPAPARLAPAFVLPYDVALLAPRTCVFPSREPNTDTRLALSLPRPSWMQQR